jgi:hypothetical protein
MGSVGSMEAENIINDIKDDLLKENLDQSLILFNNTHREEK